MSGLINLIILYVIFTSISSFVKKLKLQQGQQQAALKKSGKISRPQPKKGGSMSLEDIFAVPQPKEPPPIEDILDLEDDEIAFHAEDVPEEIPLERPPLPKRPAVKRMKPQRSASLLKFGKNGYLQGVVLSEILGPPVSQRRTRRGA